MFCEGFKYLFHSLKCKKNIYILFSLTDQINLPLKIYTAHLFVSGQAYKIIRGSNHFSLTVGVGSIKEHKDQKDRIRTFTFSSKLILHSTGLCIQLIEFSLKGINLFLKLKPSRIFILVFQLFKLQRIIIFSCAYKSLQKQHNKLQLSTFLYLFIL